LWFKPVRASGQNVVNLASNTPLGRALAIHEGDTAWFNLNPGDIYIFDGAASQVLGNIDTSKSQWYHITYVISGTDMSTATSYVNGANPTSTTIAANSYTSTNALFCNIAQNTHHLNSYVDDVALFDSALTATQIAGIYAAGQDDHSATGAVASLNPKLFYHMDENAGTTLTNSGTDTTNSATMGTGISWVPTWSQVGGGTASGCTSTSGLTKAVGQIVCLDLNGATEFLNGYPIFLDTHSDSSYATTPSYHQGFIILGHNLVSQLYTGIDQAMITQNSHDWRIRASLTGDYGGSQSSGNMHYIVEAEPYPYSSYQNYADRYNGNGAYAADEPYDMYFSISRNTNDEIEIRFAQKERNTAMTRQQQFEDIVTNNAWGPSKFWNYWSGYAPGYPGNNRAYYWVNDDTTACTVARPCHFAHMSGTGGEYLEFEPYGTWADYPATPTVHTTANGVSLTYRAAYTGVEVSNPNCNDAASAAFANTASSWTKTTSFAIKMQMKEAVSTSTRYVMAFGDGVYTHTGQAGFRKVILLSQPGASRFFIQNEWSDDGTYNGASHTMDGTDAVSAMSALYTGAYVDVLVEYEAGSSINMKVGSGPMMTFDISSSMPTSAVEFDFGKACLGSHYPTTTHGFDGVRNVYFYST
tara:strand:- start:1850 stop:3772 length:1923 start_codon:yes stop_codon:yes gene_type:complete